MRRALTALLLTCTIVIINGQNCTICQVGNVITMTGPGCPR